jgi:hypothetical protein
MEPPRRSAGGAASEASSPAGSNADDDRYGSANSALATPSSLASLRPSSDFWDHQMNLLLDDRPAGFPKNHQLSRIQAQARPAAGPAPSAADGDGASARQESSSGSPVVPARPDPDQVGFTRL